MSTEIDMTDPKNRYPWEDADGEAPYGSPDLCRACGAMLLPEHRRVADGCPCNSPRGVNHGLVPTNTCTCVECDPAQTGGTRHPTTVAEDRPDAPAPAPSERERAVMKAARQLDAAWGQGVLAPLPAALRAALAMPEVPRASGDLAKLARRLCDAVDRIPWGDISRGGGTSSIESAQAASHRLRDALATHPPTDAAPAHAASERERAPSGTFACPVCGHDEPHGHDDREIPLWLVAREVCERLYHETRDPRLLHKPTMRRLLGAAVQHALDEMNGRWAAHAAGSAHPPTDAAAAERAEIVAMLDAFTKKHTERSEKIRDDAQQTAEAQEQAVGWCSAMLCVTALRDRIAARGPGPVWTEERVRDAIKEAWARGNYAASGFAPEEQVTGILAAVNPRVRAGT